jgi:dTDP-4-dehydrorhamnose 3,5-epimerase
MDGVALTWLKPIAHPKGDILHFMKETDSAFHGFGEVYFSNIIKNNTKGWKKHTKTFLNIVVPLGSIKFVIYNEVSNEFFTITLSQQNYSRLSVKPGLWMAFKGMDDINMLANMTSIEHDPSESINKDVDDIPYDW